MSLKGLRCHHLCPLFISRLPLDLLSCYIPTKNDQQASSLGKKRSNRSQIHLGSLREFNGSNSFRSFSDSFRSFSDSFRSFSGSFRSFSDSFRSISDSFRSFSDSFRSFSDSFISFSVHIRALSMAPTFIIILNMIRDSCRNFHTLLTIILHVRPSYTNCVFRTIM